MMVGFSHFDGGRAATEHLIEAGYRRIGFIGARMDPRSQRRLAGYRAAMEAAGLFDPRLITTTPVPSSVTLGRELLRDALAKMPTLDGVFCNNDDIALGVLFECHRASIAVPKTIGIVGFNDLDMMQVGVSVDHQHPHPPLRNRPAGGRHGAGGDRRQQAGTADRRPRLRAQAPREHGPLKHVFSDCAKCRFTQRHGSATICLLTEVRDRSRTCLLYISDSSCLFIMYNMIVFVPACEGDKGGHRVGIRPPERARRARREVPGQTRELHDSATTIRTATGRNIDDQVTRWWHRCRHCIRHAELVGNAPTLKSSRDRPPSRTASRRGRPTRSSSNSPRRTAHTASRSPTATSPTPGASR